MKNLILVFTFTLTMVFSTITTFAQTDKKADKARKDMQEAKTDLKEAKVDSAADFKKFKAEATARIIDNQDRIVELREKKMENNNEDAQKYEKKISLLEEKNNELSARIKNADQTKTSMWASFKREFNHDMDELGNAFKDVVVNNKD